MGKIRVLFTIPNFLTAGSGREMFNIIERLDKNRFEPYIAVKEAGGNLYNEIIEKNYPIIVNRFTADNTGNILKTIKEAFTLSRHFKPYKFDIWQSFNWSSDYTEALVARFSKAKYLYVKKNMNWGRTAWKVKSHLSSAIIARNTTLLNNHFSPWYFRNKTHWVTGAVSPEKFRRQPSTIKKQFGIPGEAPLITCVAQIIPVKDQATLIKALAGIDDAYLVLAGTERDHTYSQALKQLISDLQLANRVFMTGNISDVNGLLSGSDVFVLPTSRLYGHEEGCPVALLEAMAAGVPCIASDVAGNNDLIINNETGLLFRPGDHEDLTSCIKKYLASHELRSQVVKTALGKVYREHTLEKEAQRFSDIYMKLVS